jgi:hypothetical protein
MSTHAIEKSPARGLRGHTITGRERPDVESSETSTASIDLYWLPLGAGGHSVRLNGRAYEALAARLGRRPVCDLYHSALEVRVPEGRFVIEQAPIRARDGTERGVVAEGAVGSRWAGRLRIFRYELRRWRDGVIPDAAEAVESPRRLSDDPGRARRLLALVPYVPTAVWGRDELHAGEMWNSNSIIAWLVTRAGLDAEAIQPPTGGRAPGWKAGLVVARRPALRNEHFDELIVEVDDLLTAIGQIRQAAGAALPKSERSALVPAPLLVGVCMGSRRKDRE